MIVKTHSVSTACPFCGGGNPLMNELSDLTRGEITQRFAGTRIECINPTCRKVFTVRRMDVRVSLGESE
jgi:hypothetical protein